MSTPRHPLHQQIPQWYQEGLSLNEIGARVGLSAAGVRYYLIKTGVSLRSRSEAFRLKFPGGHPLALEALRGAQEAQRARHAELQARIVSEYSSGTTSIADVAAKVGAHWQTVKAVLVAQELVVPAGERFRDLREQIVSLYNSGLSLRQVGQQVNRSAGAVRSALINAGVDPRGYREGWKLRCPTRRLGPRKGGTFLTTGSPERGTRKAQPPYRYIYAPDHPRCTKGGYVMEHRLVAEKKIGRYLEQDEQVHHVNGDRLDNRPENLVVMKAGHHQTHHRVLDTLPAVVDELKAQLADRDAQLERYRTLYGELPD